MAQSVKITTDQENRQEFKSRVAHRVQEILTQRPVAKQQLEMTVNIPGNFHSMPGESLYSYLKLITKLTPEQAGDVVSILNGKPQSTNIKFNLILESREIIQEKKQSVKPVEVPTIKVNLPHDWDKRTKPDLYRYLTTESRLAPEMANDAISNIYDGYVPNQYVLDFHLQDPPKIELPTAAPKKQIPKKAVTTVEVRDIPEALASLENSDLYRVLIMEMGWTPEVAGESIYQLRQAQSKNTPVEVKEVRIPVFNIALPHNYKEIRRVDLYNHLTHESHLSSEIANEAISVLDGFSSKVEFNFTTLTPPKIEPPVAQPKKELPKKVVTQKDFKQIPSEYASLNDANLYRVLIMDLGWTPEIADESIFQLRKSQVKPVVKEEKALSIPVFKLNVPHDYKTMRRSDLQYQLLRINNISADTASDFIASLDGKTPSSAALYELNVLEPPKVEIPVAQPKKEIPKKVYEPRAFAPIPEEYHSLDDAYLYRFLTAELGWVPEIADESIVQLRANEPVEIKAEKALNERRISVTLPPVFKSLKTREQYLMLTGEKNLTPNDAEDLIAHLSGVDTKTVFEVEFKER